MASSCTTNYQLNQWEAADKVLREEFNQDNAKIDAALAQEKAERMAADQAEQEARVAAVADLEERVALRELYRFTVNSSNQAGTLYITPEGVNFGQWKCVHILFSPVLPDGITYSSTMNHSAKYELGDNMTGKLHVQMFPMWDGTRMVCGFVWKSGPELFFYADLSYDGITKFSFQAESHSVNKFLSGTQVIFLGEP